MQRLGEKTLSGQRPERAELAEVLNHIPILATGSGVLAGGLLGYVYGNLFNVSPYYVRTVWPDWALCR